MDAGGGELAARIEAARAALDAALALRADLVAACRSDHPPTAAEHRAAEQWIRAAEGRLIMLRGVEAESKAKAV